MKNANKHIELLSGYTANDPMRILYDLGYKPETIKEAIIHGLGPFLRNKEHLQKDAIQLAGIWCAIIVSHRNAPSFDNNISSILTILNDAYDSDREASMACIRFWMPSILQSGSRFWSQLKNQQNLSSLNTEDFLEEVLQLIGQTIEGLSKPYLCMLLHLNRIKNSRNSTNTGEKITTLDLGHIVEELIKNSALSNVLVLKLHDLRLHHWRNIAYHHNSRIKNGQIFIDFKSRFREFTFAISRDELFETSIEIYNVFKAFKLSLDLFIEDHLDLESEWLNDKSDVLIREEALLNDFRILISSQGFKIESITDIGSDTVKMVLSDLGEDLPLNTRAIHSSQFLYSLWVLTKKCKLQVEYRTKQNLPVVVSTTSSEICETIKLDEDISKLAGHVHFEFLNVDLFKEFDPFEDLPNVVTEELKKEKYYSQTGDEIDVETYIQKVTLSIFSNYLALTGEGASDDSIEIAYLNDGCVMTGTINSKNILARIPAPIKSSRLKEILSNCVYTIIQNYKTSTLASKYLIEAKADNIYLYKREIIKTHLNSI